MIAKNAKRKIKGLFLILPPPPWFNWSSALLL
jgi:hypothetical protein